MRRPWECEWCRPNPQAHGGGILCICEAPCSVGYCASPAKPEPANL